MAVIYKATNKINGKGYIGYTKDFGARKVQHLSDARSKRTNSPFHNALRKYEFEWEILKEEANLDDEARLIQEHKTMKQFGGYNLTSGGECPKFTEETLQKMSNSQKGNTNKAGKKVRDTSKMGKWSLGLKLGPMSDSRKAAISKSKEKENHHFFGKHLSNEHKEKLSKQLKGKMAGSKHPMFGKKRSLDSRQKTSETLRRNALEKKRTNAST